MLRVPLLEVSPFTFGNPKKMAATKRKALGESLDEFGEALPLLVRPLAAARVEKARQAIAKKLELKLDDIPMPKWEVLDGHSRWADRYRAGADAVDVLPYDCPDDAKARRLILALQNRGDLDPKGLDAFVSKLLADGVSASDIGRVSALTAESCNALAQRGTEIVKGVLGNLPPLGKNVEAALNAARPPTPSRDPRQTLPPELGGTAPAPAAEQNAAEDAKANPPGMMRHPEGAASEVDADTAGDDDEQGDDGPPAPQPINRPVDQVREEYRAATFPDRERVSFAVELDPAQNELVLRAVKAAKKVQGIITTAEALALLATQFLEARP